ncbi:hypothetical protein Pelo_16442 [Pelomyxa schiedti]|nr:hypothetical protein Pelo_16442 [Pelomyxa schiedti]
MATEPDAQPRPHPQPSALAMNDLLFDSGCITIHLSLLVQSEKRVRGITQRVVLIGLNGSLSEEDHSCGRLTTHSSTTLWSRNTIKASSQLYSSMNTPRGYLSATLRMYLGTTCCSVRLTNTMIPSSPLSSSRSVSTSHL